MNKLKAGNVKNKLLNWQKITKDNKLLKKIKNAKITLRRIPRKVYSHNPPFAPAETMATMLKFEIKSDKALHS